MNYKDKYIKYKTKYLQMKNQKGGEYFIKKISTQEELIKNIPGLNMNKFPNSKGYLFYNNETLIGYAFLQKPNNEIVHPVLKELPKNKIFVWGIEILPEFQGKGYGLTMMNMILKDNKEYFLRVNKNNKPAVKLYRKLGFEVVREESIIVNEEEIPRYIMIRNKQQTGGKKLKNKLSNKDKYNNKYPTMEAKYSEHLSEPWFSLISLGLKTVEGRLNKGRFQEMQVNDIVEWHNEDFMERKILTRITSKAEYTNFAEYLETEGLEKCLPGMPSLEHGLSVYYKYFTKEKEEEFGVVAIRIELV